MEITIIGWYGTETIGDRAILAGIFHVVSQVTDKFSIRLGSLYPFYTKRTLMEDIKFYEEVSSHSLKSVSIFNSLNPLELEDNIKSSSLLMVGGGPLMDLREMSMLEYAFFYAKRKSIKTTLFGCGWGPLKNPHIRERAIRLVELSDNVIFRDTTSNEQCKKYAPQYQNKIIASVDPALFACHYFVNSYTLERASDYIAVNFRDVALEGKNYADKEISIEIFCDIIRNVVGQTGLPIRLIPMHNFGIGGDDRLFLSRVERKVQCERVKTIHAPLSLFQTMEQYYHANLCVGMRFHSIVLQTMLNGNNYIVDYTNPQTGKIIGLMHQIGMKDFYAERYESLYESNFQLNIDVVNQERFLYSRTDIQSQMDKYKETLIELC